jgi:hypothetical protein
MSSAFRFSAIAVAAISVLPTLSVAQGTRGGAACRTDAATFCAAVEAGGGRRTRCLAENMANLSPNCAAVVEARLAKRANSEQRFAQAAPAPGQPPAPGLAAGTPPPAAPPTTPIAPPVAATPAQPQPLAKGGRGNRPMAACRLDIATHCADAQSGGGGRVQCLRANQAKLTPECAAALTAVAQKRQVNKAERKGGGVQGGCADDAQRLCAGTRGPARSQCLEQKRPELSPACSAALEKRALRAAARSSAPAASGPPTATPAPAPGAVPAPPSAPKQ